MERARRIDEESLCAGPQSVRIEFRHGRWNFRKSGCDWDRHGNRWLDCLPVIVERFGGNQAHGWVSQPRRNYSDLPQPGYRRPHVPDGSRCSDALGVLTGADPEDQATTASAGKAQTNYEQYCDPNGLKGARIGVARKYFGFSDAVDALMEHSIGVMRKQGAVIVDPADVATLGKFDDSEMTVFMFELKANLNAYL